MFLLSPANCNGRRGALLRSTKSTSAVAARLASNDGVPLGELFTFVSGLYFRGKLAYASRFASPPDIGNAIVGSGVHVITPNAGLRSPDTRVTRKALDAFAAEDIDLTNPAYRRPLEQSAGALAREIGDCDVVLLGSVASPKYVGVLLEIFGERLLFPAGFVGRGDMSRGGLLLRCTAIGAELDYVPVAGAVLHGPRPPRLDPAWRAPR